MISNGDALSDGRKKTAVPADVPEDILREKFRYKMSNGDALSENKKGTAIPTDVPEDILREYIRVR